MLSNCVILLLRYVGSPEVDSSELQCNGVGTELVSGFFHGVLLLGIDS